jgi:hypothetical protein|tara:strand:+ start:53 stop:487 length:435 start_codon:yes stop_codon:yes gene_type:complete
MRNILLLLIILPNLLFSQTVVPLEYWADDNNFDEIISPQGGFDDSEESDIIVVEFWAEFNKDNAFPDWQKLIDLEGVKYYRIDIAKSPIIKKELRIRMAPTLLVYIKGDAYIKFKAKAGLDLLCPVDYPKMLKAIEVVRRESQY